MAIVDLNEEAGNEFLAKEFKQWVYEKYVVAVSLFSV